MSARGPRETVVQAQIIAYLVRSGFVDIGNQRWDGRVPQGARGVFWRNNTGAYKPRFGGFVRFGCKGSADIIGTLGPRGRAFGLECKRPVGGVLSEDQRAWGEALTATGGLYAVVNSVDAAKAALEAA